MNYNSSSMMYLYFEKNGKNVSSVHESSLIFFCPSESPFCPELPSPMRSATPPTKCGHRPGARESRPPSRSTQTPRRSWSR